MQITINGKRYKTESSLLALILKEYDAKPPYSVAVNNEFVAKDEHEQYIISESDTIDIVSPIFGG